MRNLLPSAASLPTLLAALFAWMVAADFPREPILRIEAGMHGARINQVATDAKGRFLVTASHDKTARIWEATTGKLLRILRPPIAPGAEGRLHAVAITPDAHFVLAGGYTGFDAQGSTCIYRFDRETGDLLGAFGAFPDVVQHLSLSADGAYLAAGLLGKNGVRLFMRKGDTYAMLPVSAALAFPAECYGTSFFQIGGKADQTLLAASGLDGAMRIFRVGAEGAELLETLKSSAGKMAFGVAFSTDGSRLAAGWADQNRVDAWRFGRELTPLTLPDSPLRAGNLSIVSFGPGPTLFASGWCRARGNVLRGLPLDGKTPLRDTPLCDDTVTSLLPLPDGDLAWASCDPALGRVDAQGRMRWKQTPAMAINDENHGRFAVSDDGTAFAFAYESGGPMFAFSIPKRALQPAETFPNLKVARTDGLPITDWRNSPAPKWNGKPLALAANENATCLALTSDMSGFVLGTAFKLRAYDASGRERWQKTAPALTWCVAISGDGRTALAAFADGSIRHFRMGDGEEQLAFFPHGDRLRWVLWTPHGYYDASAGADELVGWHVNRGPREDADFFPASRFRAERLRPDIIDRLATSWDELGAEKAANAASSRTAAPTVESRLPPVVTLLSPADGESVEATRLALTLRARSPGGEPVTNFRILLDGRPLAATRGLAIKTRAPSSTQNTPEPKNAASASTDERRLEVELPERDVLLTVCGENIHGVGTPASVRLRWKGAVSAEPKPRLFALAIGVSAYRDPALRLQFAAKDAADFMGMVRAQKGKQYREVSERLLVDGQATREKCEAAFEWIRSQTKADDTAMVFLAGHGVSDPAGKFWVLPVDADTARLPQTCLGFSVVRKAVTSIAGRALFFIDTCQSGNVLGDRSGTDGLVNELAAAENGVIVFTSATGRQFAFEDSAWGNGAFTKALIESLGGAAGYDETGAVTVFGVNWYLSKRVKELTGRKQTPATAIPATVPDFPVMSK